MIQQWKKQPNLKTMFFIIALVSTIVLGLLGYGFYLKFFPSLTLKEKLKQLEPKLYIFENWIESSLKWPPENDKGYIEYKRNLLNIAKISKYATQMQFRIRENVQRNFAIYYLGVEDDGSVMGFTTHEQVVECVAAFLQIVQEAKASISLLEIIHAMSGNTDKIILKVNVTSKKKSTYDNFGFY
jgi:hypothetical protein